MSLAIYVRVLTQRQAHAQTIEQQLERLRTHIRNQGWELTWEHIFRDDGYSGASRTDRAWTVCEMRSGRRRWIGC